MSLVDVVRAQVTLSGVGQEHHYTLAFIFSSLSHFNGGFKCCTRGVTAQDAFLGCGQVGGFNGVLVAHLNHLIVNTGIEHVGYKTGTDALNFMGRSEEHTSELQSRPHLVCRLLLEKKKKKQKDI